MTNNYHIMLLNGPNLNLINNETSNLYGNFGNSTLENVIKNLYIIAKKSKIKLDYFQSNAEHDLINCIHKSKKNINFIIINPAAFTHTSISIRDALLLVNIPFIEIHISNIYARESFRHYSYISDIAVGVICGFGTYGYILALHAAISYLSRT